MEDQDRQAIVDGEHLRILALMHYVSGAMTIMFSSLFIFHLVFLSLAPFAEGMPESEDMRQTMGVFAVFLGAVIALGIAYGCCEIAAGVMIRRLRLRWFTFAVAIPRLVMLPYGTILSIFTLMVIERASVKERYLAAATERERPGNHGDSGGGMSA